MNASNRTCGFAVLLGVLIAACGGEVSEEAAASGSAPAEAPPVEAGPATVVIESPSAGAVLETADVAVTLSASGIEIAPVAEGRMGTAHHHLFLDADVTAAGQPVPQDNPAIVHMGDGRSTHTFEGVAPGPHRLIAVLADLGHVPLDPPVADTIEFQVNADR